MSSPFAQTINSETPKTNKAMSTGKSNKEKQILKIVTWNIQGLNKEGKLKESVQELHKYDIDILAVQEINAKGTAITSFKKYIWCIGGGVRNKLGTGFIIKEKLKNKIVDYRIINERLSVIRIKGKCRKLTILNVHAFTEETGEDTKQTFYDTIEESPNNVASFDMKIIIIGDFNAKIGKEERNYEIAGKESLRRKSNKNGQRLIDLAPGNRMIIKTIHLKHKDIHKQTWISPDKKTLNQIYHLLIEKKNMQNVS
ncbi:hypothetical protein ILUMI_13280 [Ignelater luminosus]|uniref:Endonuclease/exonuclease/phosphatase domain-containing protein n=1 Tax=Ignelater luminosus TaxID=2038154 RepID=A0A8K0GBK3_IGNLU|nr:hypothetical protein ILUMI_13280 [Ignelater luminosus]